MNHRPPAPWREHARESGARLTWSVLGLSGAYLIGRRVTRDAAAVLTYHRVRPDGSWTTGPRHPNVVSTSEFDRQIAYLARHYQIMSGDTFRDAVRGSAGFPPHAALITFDDGYRDNYAEALPILRRHGASAIFFVSTGFIGDRTNQLWLDQLDAIVSGAGESRITHWLAARGLNLGLRDRGRLRAWAKRLPAGRRSEVIRDLQRAFGRMAVNTAADAAPMTWDEVGALADAGMTIGSHTVTHQILAAAGRDEARDELGSSRAEIERRLGNRCWAFSYPNGEADDFRRSDMEDVRDAGYECGFTQIQGFVTSHSDAYALPRIPVPAAPGLDVFRSHVSGVHVWLRSATPGAIHV